MLTILNQTRTGKIFKCTIFVGYGGVIFFTGVAPNTKREKNIHVFNVLTQVGVKQLTDFLRTVTAASDLVDCTLVNCDCITVAI